MRMYFVPVEKDRFRVRLIVTVGVEVAMRILSDDEPFVFPSVNYETLEMWWFVLY